LRRAWLPMCWWWTVFCRQWFRCCGGAGESLDRDLVGLGNSDT
jgi:hypothetical protein